MDLKRIFEEANIETRLKTFEKEGRDVMIYPCGFAWIYFPGGKRNPIGKKLKKLGIVSYDSYRRSYQYWIHDYNQSMNHKERHAQVLSEILSKKLNTIVGYSSRID
jgi:hypothetical protein